MNEQNQSEQRSRVPGELAAAARHRGMERLEGVKAQVAEGAERVAAAVDRTADELENDGDETVSGFGHSLSGLMRQLAGGLRERDIEQFAAELGALARRNPGVFLAGSVALGFGVARFFKARPPGSAMRYEEGRRGDRPVRDRDDFDADESLDLSRNPAGVDRRDDADRAQTAAASGTSAPDAQPGGPETAAQPSSGIDSDTGPLRGGKEP